MRVRVTVVVDVEPEDWSGAANAYTRTNEARAAVKRQVVDAVKAWPLFRESHVELRPTTE